MTQTFTPENPERFQAALQRFNDENSRDPNQAQVDGQSVPKELLYASWVSDWVLRLDPNASESLRLAARSVHLGRWALPRSRYPMTRPGYLRWRQELKGLHAQKVGSILQEVGYPADFIQRVTSLVSKSVFPHDPESRVLEDALCLVFLEHQFADLAARSTDEQMCNALQKTWKKMTPAAQEIARNIEFGPREQALIHRALLPDL